MRTTAPENFVELDKRMFELENIRSMVCEGVQGRGSAGCTANSLSECIGDVVQNAIHLSVGKEKSRRKLALPAHKAKKLPLCPMTLGVMNAISLLHRRLSMAAALRMPIII